MWQPARKSTANENRRPIYVFSTDLANLAADAVMKNRYDTIVQFHNAQPKGPGFLSLPKEEEAKKETISAHKASDNEKEGNTRAPKRRSSRLSASDETPSTKKLRSGGQTKLSEDSKRTRFSRRLRKRQQTSSSPPSSSASDHSSSDSQPSPVSYRRRGGQRSNRGGARKGGRGRNLGQQRGEIEEASEKEEEDEEEEEGGGEEDGKMRVSRDADRVEAAEDHTARRTGDAGQDISPHESAQTLTQQTLSQQTPAEEENNYTICHGTPRTKNTVDMSSPASKPLLQTRLPKSTAVSSPSGASCTTPPSVSHPTQHDIASLSVVEKQQKQSLSNTPVAVSGSRTQDPMLGQHAHPDLHKDATAPNNWPGGLSHQFSHVPGGYYSAGIHPMHYPPHATQHVPGANYSYGMYPWVGQPTREQHSYVTHESAQQLARSVASSQAGHLSQSAGHTTSPHVAYQHHPHAVHHLRPSASTPSETGKELSSASSQGHESGSAVMKHPPSHEKHSLPSTQPHHVHSHSALRQLTGPGSTQAASLSQVHHAFPRPEQMSAATAVHHPGAAAAAAAFPYGFDPSNPAALSHMHHLWQQQQQQIRAAGVHPSHLPPHLQHPSAAAGMWYPHMQQLMHGGLPEGIPDESAKRRAVVAQSSGSKHPPVDVRMNSNRNNNNDDYDTQRSLTLHQVHPPSGLQSHVPSHSMLPRGDADLAATSQAMEWTRHGATDVQKITHLTSSFPR